MPEAAELQDGDEDLRAQVNELQKNVTAIWNYIYQLRSAVSHHLTHLREHQVELETSMHRMEHLHESKTIFIVSQCNNLLEIYTNERNYRYVCLSVCV